MSVTFHAVDFDDAPLVAAAHRLFADYEQELNPDDPCLSLDEFVPMMTSTVTDVRNVAHLALDGTEPVALSVFNLSLDPDNRDYADGETLYVVPGRRRQRLGRRLLRFALDDLAADGYAKTALWANDDLGHAFCASLGLARKTEERLSRALVADIDPDQQADWARGERATAAGYRLVRIDGHCPDEYLEALCTAKASMADQPLGDLDYTYPAVTPEKIRAKEQHRRNTGMKSYRRLAIAPDGAGAGYTELVVNTFRPALGHQGDTGVVDGHRGLAIGKWLKAVNLADVLAEHPELHSIETYNAEDNPWMLDINVAMGFRPHHRWTAWGGSIADIHP